MMTSAGAVLFSITVVFANTMITNGPHPSYMDPNPAAGPPKTAAHTPRSRLRNSPVAAALRYNARKNRRILKLLAL
jgi:hypothetical protein